MDVCEDCGASFDLNDEGGVVDGCVLCDDCYEFALEEAA